MSAEEIEHNKARFGCWHIACGRHLDQGRRQGAAPWLERKMSGVAPMIEPVRHIIEGARAYNSQRGLPDPHQVDYHGIRQTADRVAHLSRAYAALPHFDPQAVPHFAAMRDEVNHQFDHLTNRMGIRAEFVDHDPYRNAAEMAADLRHNKRIQVLRTAMTGHHPFFTDEENDKFRAVHDAFGHAGTGRDFDGHGEEAAFHAHARMFSPVARAAMASETRGQNGYVIHHDEFGPQKIALLPNQLWTPEGMTHHGAADWDEFRRVQDGQQRRYERAGVGGGQSERDELERASRASTHPEEFMNGYHEGLEHGFGETRIATLLGPDGQPVLHEGRPMTARLRSTHLTKTSHVSGNQTDVFHCPFCGSGDIVSRSDGSIECGFCNSAFTVTVSPMYPAFPMSVNGQPYPWPGRPEEAMPGGDGFGGQLIPGGGGADDVPADGDGDDAPPWAEDDGDDDSGDEPDDAGGSPEDGDDQDTEAEVGGKKKPPFGKKSAADPAFHWRNRERAYHTGSGAVLPESEYLRHLAIATARDPNAVAARIRAERV